MLMQEIVNEILSCKKCDLHKTKTNYVPGVGNEGAEIVFVGEAPGRDEDLQGEPFVGAAGKLLTEMLASIGLRREDVYITNILKCRPPNNRDPAPDEIEKCGDYLVRQLDVIKPNVIVCLGRFAAQFIFNLIGLQFTTISRVKGKVYEVERWGKKIGVVALYHPAAVLYKPQLREEYENDFRKIGELCKRKQPTLFDYL